MGRKPPQLVREIFEEAANGKDFINPKEFASILRKWQGHDDITEEKAAEIITNVVSQEINVLDLTSFMNYLLDPSLNPAMVVAQAPVHDMTAPLPHYYINTSHNSYLRGNQLTSKSCTSPIVAALQSGCRVIELDCWERRNKIMVLHGGTLTKAVPFDQCVRAIKENAFVASEYPVIITIENHLPPALQKEAAKILKEVIADALYIPPSEKPPKEFMSPEELKGKIIISDKPPKQHIAKQVADDPEGAFDAMPPNSRRSNASSSGSDSSDSYSSDEPPQGPDFKRDMNRNIARRVKKTADAVAASKLAEEEHSARTISNVPELQELLYIYCSKPSEMEKAPVNGELFTGENAIMANMSEPQLKKSILVNPSSLIQYTKNNLGRMYPYGLRFDSSNADPMLAWSHGFQLAAMNFQGRDRSCWVANGFFRTNGGCGYIRKPDCFLSHTCEDHNNLSPKLVLKVKVLMGTDWHRRFDLFTKPDFYVKVAVHGIPADKLKKRTKVAHRKEEPNWETEQFEFPLRVPEIAVLRFEVWEHDRVSRDDFVGQACIPVRELQNGIRVVVLHSKRGVPRRSKLLCHFAIDSNPPTM